MERGYNMRILIAEDDYASRKFLYKFLSAYGECDITIDGIEAVDAFMLALDEGKPYDLVCLDIMMPKLDGTRALKAIRDVEKQRGIEGDRYKVKKITFPNYDSDSSALVKMYLNGDFGKDPMM